MCIATVAILVVVSIVASSAAPTHDTLSVDLAEVMNKSVCLIKSRTDEVKDRIPYRIKVLECANRPNPMCDPENTPHACCGTHHHKFRTECVNVIDHVLVRYRNQGDDEKLHKYPVSVGCACMIRETTSAMQAQ